MIMSVSFTSDTNRHSYESFCLKMPYTIVTLFVRSCVVARLPHRKAMRKKCSSCLTVAPDKCILACMGYLLDGQIFTALCASLRYPV